MRRHTYFFELSLIVPIGRVSIGLEASCSPTHHLYQESILLLKRRFIRPISTTTLILLLATQSMGLMMVWSISGCHLKLAFTSKARYQDEAVTMDQQYGVPALLFVLEWRQRRCGGLLSLVLLLHTIQATAAIVPQDT
ncbi:hypothetical protein BJY00DRAFT_274296 [Aspergillus carlsbadensis]|nr:hypothetical protein BJY00DRAFT_274296 [Aspergillus carlsbadensis]